MEELKDQTRMTIYGSHLHHSFRLMFTRTARPKRPQGCNGLIPRLLLLLGVIVKVQGLTLVPQVLINLVLSRNGARKPFDRGLFSRR